MNDHSLSCPPFLLLLATLAAACGPAQGGEGAACYPNNTCDPGLVCLSKTCVDPDPGSSASEAGSADGATSVGIDLEMCFACGDAACPTQRSECELNEGCAEMLRCTVGCGSDVACASSCNASDLSQEAVLAATQAVQSYVTCSVQSCLNECSPTGETTEVTAASTLGGEGGTLGGATSGTGPTSGDTSATTSAEATSAEATSAEASSSTGNTTTTSSDSEDDTTTPGVVNIFDGSAVVVDAASYGIAGSFFILEDGVAEGVVLDNPYLEYSDLDPFESPDEPSTFEESEMPCVTGVIARVTTAEGIDCEYYDEDCAWGDLWGGGIGLTLNEVDGEASAWNATEVGVIGFGFDLYRNSDVGVSLRFLVEDIDGEQFCTSASLISGGIVTFDDLEHNCWDPDALSLDPSKIKQMSWQFVPNASEAFAIDEFCVTGVYVIE